MEPHILAFSLGPVALALALAVNGPDTYYGDIIKSSLSLQDIGLNIA